MPVRRVLALRITAARLHQVGGPVHIDVHDPLEMGEDRHPRLGLHPPDQPLAAPRHDHVDQAPSSSASRRPPPGRGSARAGSRPRAARPPPARNEPAWIARVECRLSEPPRRIAALPAFRQSAPASAVTFGRLSKITPMTPIGVRTRRMCRPDGLSHSAITVPPGRAAPPSRAGPRPWPRTRSSVSFSRSSIAADRPAARVGHVLGIGGEDRRAVRPRSRRPPPRSAASFAPPGRRPARTARPRARPADLRIRARCRAAGPCHPLRSPGRRGAPAPPGPGSRAARRSGPTDGP